MKLHAICKPLCHPCVTAAARYLLALLFIFSGAAKAVDTFGLSIKLGEYFSAMGLGFLGVFDTAGALLLPALEMLVGFMLLGGVSRRLASWAVFLAMSFFTLLTLWIAVADPVSDCGCFGDLVKLTNWETFFKNLVFWPLSFILWRGRNEPWHNGRTPSVLRTAAVYAILIPVSLALGLYSYSYLPPVDPTPFRVGVNIPHAMAVHDGATETILVYRDRTDGKLHDFSIEDTTWYDSSRWEYVDTKTIGQSAAPEIKTVPMFEGNIDRSAEILERKGYTLLFVVNDYDPAYREDMAAFAAYVLHFNGRAVALSAGNLPASLGESGIEAMGSDYTVLHTMVQHRTGGAILLHDGTILGKWAMNRLPQWDDTAHDPLANVLTDDRATQTGMLYALFVLGVAVVGLITARLSEPRK